MGVNFTRFYDEAQNNRDIPAGCLYLILMYGTISSILDSRTFFEDGSLDPDIAPAHLEGR